MGSGCMHALNASASMHKHMHKHQASAQKKRLRRAGARSSRLNPQKNPSNLWITMLLMLQAMHKQCLVNALHNHNHNIKPL